ncbi:hypothetical protein NDU88_005167 [Pleurodeles waltl]|uniref:Uncharacterized protein n=1 Tax=Pleurodeles waltl TaxID=8319 RepID=A0AAV7RKR6_PLEWA|nr:hypothetical protein NDU88_005167 [Pleurodeles waltl]
MGDDFTSKLYQVDFDVLRKGLSFVPSQRIDKFEIMKDIQAFCRKIRLNKFFQNRELTDDHSLVKFKPRSTCTPSLDQIGPEVAIFERIIYDKIKEVLRYVPAPVDNLTYIKRESMKNLQRNKDIIVKLCDKEGGIILMDTEHYKQKMKKMLAVPEHYKKITDNSHIRIDHKIQAICERGIRDGSISKCEADFLMDAFSLCSVSTYLTAPQKHVGGSDSRMIGLTTVQLLPLSFLLLYRDLDLPGDNFDNGPYNIDCLLDYYDSVHRILIVDALDMADTYTSEIGNLEYNLFKIYAEYGNDW